jgi:hypothetical protein
MLRNLFIAVSIFAGLSGIAMAQAPASAATTQIFSSDAGFSYNYPSDWTVVNMQPAISSIRKDVESKSTSESEKKGADCTQLALMLEHGEHSSMIEAMVLPFDCTGNPMTEKDLPSVGVGMSQGLSSYLDTNTPTYGSYKRGTHAMWIEKLTGNFKDKPEQKLQIEVVCGLLQKSLVCWMAFAYTDADLKVFEQSSAKLENDTLPQLVPADAFTASKDTVNPAPNQPQ